jgi:hypothetical protein
MESITAKPTPVTKSGKPKSYSSGVRKNRPANAKRKSPVVSDFPGLNFIRHQKENRWPSNDTMIKAYELSIDRKGGTRRGASIKKIKPMNSGFTMLDCLIGSCPKALETVLLAASLKLKRVRRYPGYVLIRTYNLKNRAIEII